MRDAKRAHFIGERFRLVHRMMRAKVQDPVAAFQPGSRGNDGEAGELARELDHDRSDAAGAADDKQRAFARRVATNDSHAVMLVSGSAAACAKFSERGFSAAMRSSTRCSSLLVPARAIEPA